MKRAKCSFKPLNKVRKGIVYFKVYIRRLIHLMVGLIAAELILKGLARNHVGLYLKDLKYLTLLPQVIPRFIYLVAGRKTFLGTLDFVITTRCTLRCKNCSNLLQYYDIPVSVNGETIVTKSCDADVEIALADIDRLLGVVDYIGVANVLGGETLLYKELVPIIEKLISTKKVRAIKIFTNGTIRPKASIIELLKHKKVKLYISNYPEEIVKKRNKVLDFLEEHGIAYRIAEDFFWKDYGNITKKKLSPKQLTDSYVACFMKNCVSMLDGKIHICPRSAHGMNLKAIPDNKKDYVDLRTESPVRARKKLRCILAKKKYITACHYCNGQLGKKVIPGLQMNLQESAQSLF